MDWTATRSGVNGHLWSRGATKPWRSDAGWDPDPGGTTTTSQTTHFDNHPVQSQRAWLKLALTLAGQAACQRSLE